MHKLVLSTIIFINCAQAQLDTVTIVHVNDANNTIANEAVDFAFSTFQNKTKDKRTIKLIRTYSNETLQGVVSLVLDTTKQGYNVTKLPILTSSYSRYNMSSDDKLYVQALHPKELFCGIVFAIVKQQRFRNAAILYDHEFDITSPLINSSFPFLLTPLQLNTLTEQLLNLTHQGIKNYFIIANNNTVLKVLTEACDLTFINYKYAWYAITQSDANITNFCDSASVIYINSGKNILKSLFNLTFIEEVSYEFYYELGNLALKTALLVNVTDLSGFNVTTDLMKLLTAETRRTYYGNWVFEKTALFPIKMTINSVEIVNGNLTNADIGVWEAYNNAIQFKKDRFKEYRSFFMVKIGTFIQQPYVQLRNKSLEGLCIDLIDSLASYCNFKYNLSLKNSLDDLTMSLNANEIDLAIGTIPTEQGVAFNEGTGITILSIKKPHDFNFFTNILNMEMWLTILVIGTLTSFTLYIYDYYSPCVNSFEETSPVDTLKFTFFSFAREKVTWQPNTLSGKVAAGTFYLFIFLISTFYFIKLCQLITHKQPPIDKIEDLLNHKVNFTVVENSQAHDFIKNQSKLERAIFQEYLSEVLNSSVGNIKSSVGKYSVFEYPFSDTYVRLERMLNSRVLPKSLDKALLEMEVGAVDALIGDYADFRHVEMARCNYYVAKEVLRKRKFAFVLRSGIGENVEKLFKDVMNELTETKIIINLERKWWSKRNPCPTGIIQLDHLVGIFKLFLASAAVFALFFVATWFINSGF